MGAYTGPWLSRNAIPILPQTGSITNNGSRMRVEQSKQPREKRGNIYDNSVGLHGRLDNRSDTLAEHWEAWRVVLATDACARPRVFGLCLPLTTCRGGGGGGCLGMDSFLSATDVHEHAGKV